MKLEVRRGDLVAQRAGAWVVGVLEAGGPLGGAARAVDRATRGALAALLDSGDFTGRWLELALLHPGHPRTRRVIVVGLGSRAALTPHRVRLAMAAATRRARELGAGTVATVAHGASAGGLDPIVALTATVEGARLGHERLTAFKTEPGPKPLVRITIFERWKPISARQRRAVARGDAIASGTCLARDLANTPGDALPPDALARRARQVARDAGASVQVLGVPQMTRLGMGLLLAVGRGSPNPPRFVVLDRAAPRGVKRAPTVVLVGKGVTFDTGGISLKPRENMNRMKYDMAGAAAVLGLFAALPQLAVPVRVVGLIASAENMPGGRAFKPGDVLRALDGTTVEVTNTDAEGRLVLADALVYARRFKPDAVIDLATLTGAVSIALGNLAAGLFTDDDAIAGELTLAGEVTGERLWRLPLWDEYASELRSDTADLVNSSVPQGGAILGAMFLKRFARGLPWAHLDIASTGWTSAERAHEPRGATGFGVRLLAEWLSTRYGGRA